MATRSWKSIVQELQILKKKLDEQHFQIDVSYKLNRYLAKNTLHRSDLNTPAIAAYWGYEVVQRHILESMDLKISAVFFELDYYSYLNIGEIADENTKIGNTTMIVDLITDSTDVKTGEDLEDWMTSNFFFQAEMKDLWNDQMLDVWKEEGRLVTRNKKNINLSSYWNYEDYLYILTVKDQDLSPVVMFLLGTFTDYQGQFAQLQSGKIVNNPGAST